MLILAIDTSCDDTSAAVTKNNKILSNVISSQIELHKKYGGVVPILAQRAHKEKIDAIITEALKRAKTTLKDIDVFAVTQGPGLAPALEVGIAKAKELARRYKKPLIPVNHMEGHIYANFTDKQSKIKFPIFCVLTSGNHTELILMEGHGKYKIIGQTLDDAIGEAFDKVGRMLGLGYPGGPLVEKLAKEGKSGEYTLPVPLEKSKECDLSYSGLKTAVLYTIRRLDKNDPPQLSKSMICNMCASFEEKAIEHLIQKTKLALEKVGSKYPIYALLAGGGVVANQRLRKNLRKVASLYSLPFIYPDIKKLCMDNAAMIAIAAWHMTKRNLYAKNPQKIERKPNWSL